MELSRGAWDKNLMPIALGLDASRKSFHDENEQVGGDRIPLMETAIALKLIPSTLLITMAWDALVTHFMNRLIHLLWNPSLSMLAVRKDQDTLS